MKKIWNNVWSWYKSLRRVWQVAIAIGLGVLTIGAVADDKQVQKQEAAAIAAKKAAEPKVVDVRGLTLPEARKALKRDGNYRADPESIDTIMAIYIEENFVVCEQEKPKGHLIPLKVAKRGCED